MIDTIVSDIISSEPSLRDQEPALRAAIEKILASRPDVPHDDAFFASLRADLVRQFAARPAQPQGIMKILSMLGTKPMLMPAGAFAALLLIAFVAVPSLRNAETGTASLMDATGVKSGMRITSAGAGAFGSLALGTSGSGDASAVSMNTRPQSGGGMGLGGGAGIPTAAAPIAVGESAKISADTSVGASMIAPMPMDVFVFAYRYEGEPLSLDAATLPVLRRVKGSGTAAGASLASMLAPLLDVSKLSSLKVQSFSSFEDKPFGMSVYADLVEESVSLSQYYPQWPHPEQQCRDQECYERLRVRESDLLSDNDALAAATRFMTEYGLNADGYGAPEVRKDWRRWYDAMPNKAEYWFPETISVVYPLTVNGTRVVEEGGAPYGPTVNVNVRAERADGVWNVFSRNYESADYAMETDAATILSVAERGGVHAWVPDPSMNAKVVDVRLGTPERVYVRTWQYGGDGTGKELLVPALRFPVLDANTPNGVPPEAIVIPLAKELMTRQDGGFGGGPIMYMKGGEVRTEPAVSTGAVTPAVAPDAPVPDVR